MVGYMIIELFGVPACGKSTYIKKYINDANVVLPLDLYLYRTSRLKQNLNKIVLVMYAFSANISRCLQLNRLFWNIKFSTLKRKIKMWLYLFSVLGAKWKGEKNFSQKTLVLDEGVNQVIWGLMYNAVGSELEILHLQNELISEMGDKILWLYVPEKELINRLLRRDSKGGSELEHEIKNNQNLLKIGMQYAEVVVRSLRDNGVRIEQVQAIKFSEEKMKVLYLINSLKNGGPVNMLYTLVKHINKSECEIVVVAFKEAPKNNARDFSTLDCKVHIIGSEKVRACISEVQQLVDKEKPDIVHSHGGVADIVNSKVYGYHKRFSTVHCDPDEDFTMKNGRVKGWIKASAFIHTLRKIEHPIACSKTVSDKLRYKRHVDIDFVRNGIDLDKRKSTENYYSRDDLGLAVDDIVLVFCGYLSPRKNIQFICDALASVDRKDITLIVLGNGVEYENVCDYSKRDERIKAIGRVENAYKFLNACDYFISASKSEGLPLAVMEGMSCGLPALLSDIESHQELKTCCDEGIEVFSINDIDDLKKILCTLKKPSDINRKIARSVIENYLNADRMATEYVERYR